MYLYIHIPRETRNADRILVGKPEMKRSLEAIGEGVMAILEWILGKQVSKLWTDTGW
jgi:hypothetical protein